MAQRRFAGAHEAIEHENDELVEGLSHKVDALRSLSIEIGDEVRSHHSLLQRMDGEVDSAGGFLGSSMRRVRDLGQAGHNRWMCYMLMLVLFVFLVIYIVNRWF